MPLYFNSKLRNKELRSKLQEKKPLELQKKKLLLLSPKPRDWNKRKPPLLPPLSKPKRSKNKLML